MTKAKLKPAPEVRGSLTPMQDRILSIAEFCREADMSRPTFYKHVEAGRIKIARDGKRVKIDFGGDEGAILLDGTANQVSDIASDANAADTTIKVSWDDWQQMAAGQLDGMTAFMMGKLKVEGDMSNAMQLQGVLAKLRS